MKIINHLSWLRKLKNCSIFFDFVSPLCYFEITVFNWTVEIRSHVPVGFLVKTLFGILVFIEWRSCNVIFFYSCPDLFFTHVLTFTAFNKPSFQTRLYSLSSHVLLKYLRLSNLRNETNETLPIDLHMFHLKCPLCKINFNPLKSFSQFSQDVR